MNRFTFYLLILVGFNFVTLNESISKNKYVTDYTSVNSIEIVDVINLPNGEVVAMGSTIIAGENELIVFKNDSTGNLLWSNVLTSGSTDYFSNGKLVAGKNFGFAILGTTADGGKTKTVVIKADNAGNVLWSNKYNNGQGEVTNDISSTNDGGVVLTGGGCIGNNLFVHKIDVNGKSEWFKLIGSTTQHEMGLAIIELPNSDIMVAGSTLNAINGSDVILFRLDSQGKVIWEINYGSSVNDIVRNIEEKDGFIYLAGNTQTARTSQAFITKVSVTNGSMIWNKILANSGMVSLFEMKLTNNAIILGGLTNATGGYGANDATLTKLDIDGNIVKSIIVGDATDNLAKAISSTRNGLIVLSTMFNGVGNIAKLDNDLNGYCDFKLCNMLINNQIATSSSLVASNFLIGVFEERHLLAASNFTLVANQLSVAADFNFTLNAKQVSLSNSSTGAVSYSWDFGDGNAISDESPNHVFASSGTYTICLTVTNSLGCLDTKCKEVTVKTPSVGQLDIDKFLPNANYDVSKPTLDVDGNEIDKVVTLTMFPNPVVNEITFQLLGDKKISSVNIFSGNGQLLGNKKMGVSKANINVVDLAPGVYFYQVKVENQDQLINGRFIKN